ncbi:MAG: UDP-N-acetylmuramate dehydrogenase [Gammaproteobacteria bacterium]|nr:UDP-N-acetylmuramate dehydrogenase [Gammaproteobacteria bacterium]
MMAASKSIGLRGQVLRNEPMAKHTSWRVGGLADYFFKPADRDDLIQLLQTTHEPILFVGLGSNLLVRDGGIRGWVVCLQGVFEKLSIDAETGIVLAEAGVSCAQLARAVTRQGLIGAEFFAGIPGTLGGALAMNAGAFGGETWNVVQRVEWLSMSESYQWMNKDQFLTAYRHVTTPAQGWFFAAELKFSKVESSDAIKAGEERIKELLNQRSTTQPIGVYSCGSVFKNPPNNYAARLIESCGLKGFRMGDAEVSPKHANFIVNRGKASAIDIERLIGHVQTVVMRDTGISLQTEVRVVGDAS